MQERIRTIDKKLQYQIEKLLAAATAVNGAVAEDGSAEGDPLSFGPQPDQLVEDVSPSYPLGPYASTSDPTREPTRGST